MQLYILLIIIIYHAIQKSKVDCDLSEVFFGFFCLRFFILCLIYSFNGSIVRFLPLSDIESNIKTIRIATYIYSSQKIIDIYTAFPFVAIRVFSQT